LDYVDVSCVIIQPSSLHCGSIASIHSFIHSFEKSI